MRVPHFEFIYYGFELVETTKTAFRTYTRRTIDNARRRQRRRRRQQQQITTAAAASSVAAIIWIHTKQPIQHSRSNIKHFILPLFNDTDSKNVCMQMAKHSKEKGTQAKKEKAKKLKRNEK